MSFLTITFLILSFFSQVHAIQFRGRNITTFTPITPQEVQHRRILFETDVTLAVIKRNLTAYPNPILTLEKGYHLIRLDTYVPKEGDEIAEWLPEHKVAPNLRLPYLVRCMEKCRFLNETLTSLGQEMTPNRWILNGSVDIDSVIREPLVILVETLPKLSFSTYDTIQTNYRPPIESDEEIQMLGSGVIISVCDTCLDTQHKAFFDPYLPTPPRGNIVPSSHAKVASHLTAIPGFTDYSGRDGCHGTATSGAAAGFQVYGESGVAPGARVAFYDFSPTNSEDIYLPASFPNYLLDVCAQGGATVINLSFGSLDTKGAYDELSDICDEVALLRPDCAIVVACGNEGPTGKCASPSTGFNVLSVGASFSRHQAYPFWPNATNNPDRYQCTVAASFSSGGPLPDGRRAPLFYAPGVYDRLPFALAYPVAEHYHYSLFSGTSFSAPKVVGFIAEIQRRYRAINQGRTPPTVLVGAMLISFSEPMTGEVMNIVKGVGAVPLSNPPAISSFGCPILPAVGLGGGMDFTATLTSTGGEILTRVAYCFRVSNLSLPLVAGVVWHDVPGPTLVNDVDVRLFSDGVPTYPIYGDVSNPNERIELMVSTKQTVRMLIYEADEMIQRTIPLGVYVLNVEDGWECGTCMPHETQECVLEGVVGFRGCNVTTGNFEDTCQLTERPFPFQDDGSYMSCDTVWGKGVLLSPDQCHYTTCKSDLALQGDTNQCKCLEGTERTCGVEKMQMCGENGTRWGTECYPQYEKLTKASMIEQQEQMQTATNGDSTVRGGKLDKFPATVFLVALVCVLWG